MKRDCNEVTNEVLEAIRTKLAEIGLVVFEVRVDPSSAPDQFEVFGVVHLPGASTETEITMTVVTTGMV